MPLFEFGTLGGFVDTYCHADKGRGIDIWRDGESWYVVWGRRGFIAEFGRGKCSQCRPWRVSWGMSDQITFYEPRKRRFEIDDILDGLEGAGLISIGGEEEDAGLRAV